MTDASNASRTLLMNIHDGDWDDELLAMLRRAAGDAAGDSVVERSVRRSRCASRSSQAGRSPASRATSRRRCSARRASSPAGEEHVRHRLLHADEHGQQAVDRRTSCSPRSPGRRAASSSTRSKAACSSAAPWCPGCATGWASSSRRPTLRSLRDRCPTAAALYLVPAFDGPGAPHWDPYARGAIVGITRGTTAAHIARAAVESIALQVADLADAMRSDAASAGSGDPRTTELTELRVDGGAASTMACCSIRPTSCSCPSCGRR